jgi:hypothetical protein
VQGQGDLPPAEIDTLNPMEYMVYHAWRGGADLKKLFKQRKTVNKYRKALLAHGIDVSVPYLSAENGAAKLPRGKKITSHDAFSKPFSGAPEWAKNTSLYFESVSNSHDHIEIPSHIGQEVEVTDTHISHAI